VVDTAKNGIKLLRIRIISLKIFLRYYHCFLVNLITKRRVLLNIKSLDTFRGKPKYRG
jgi:hypothetical protein